MTDPFARRQPGRLTHADLRWIAQGPSWRAPRLADLNHAAAIDYDRLMRGNRIAGRAFIAHGAELARRGKLTDVQLVAVAPFLDELAACPHLLAVAALNLAGNRIGPGGLAILLGSPYLTNLTKLDLSNNELGDDGTNQLAGTSSLPALRELILAGNGISETAVLDLRRRSHFAPHAIIDPGPNSGQCLRPAA